MIQLLALLALLAADDLPTVSAKDDLVITQSCRIRPGTYVIEDAGEPGVLRIEGDDLLVDLTGVTIVGAKKGTDPDRYRGTGLIVTGNRNIVRRGAFRGFRVAVRVDGGEGHWLFGLDVSNNFAQRLASTREKEVSTDWLWPHHNDDGEWAKVYGAGIHVERAKGVRVIECSGHNSQNGLILDRSNGCVVRRCDFSFNSGWGIALWRSSENRLERNRCDFCVRGYSHGVYDRGQDSAGFLVFEQCHRNEFRENSATHGGDGFFLYAGHETTKKTGEGGCNDNLVVGNDFSHAVANGIEATFSSGNRFLDNRLDDCNYGVWAGYSRKTEIRGNVMRGCTYAGVGIEHGSENVIAGNVIEDSRRGVWLWWDEDKEFLESVYGKKTRTDSADTEVSGNLIRGGKAGLFLDRSARIRFVGNTVEGLPEDAVVVTKGECPDLVVEAAKEPVAPKVRAWRDAPGARRGRKHIVVHEWGPYDYRAPLLVPRRISGRPTAVFTLLGLTRTPKLVKTEGPVTVHFRMDSGGLPQIVVKPAEGAPDWAPFRFVLEAQGAEIVGEGVLLRAEWAVRHWAWEKDPREDPEAFAALLKTKPGRERKLASLELPWRYGGPGDEVGKDRFATVAETTLDLPEGEWEIVTVSDDGVRVFVDGEKILENWTHHGPTEDRATVKLAAGKHRIRVEHFEIDGMAWLSFRIEKKAP
ncbi:MAG: right-handed parallel beta-helix repeat-containing protein [Planctomycetota bacterium]